MSLQIFRLPDLGEGLTEADLVRWLVKVGDTVVVDEPIAEVETAKSTVEVPSPFGGVVVGLHGEEGETLRVGEPFLSVELPGGEGSGPDQGSTDQGSTDQGSAGPGNTGQGSADQDSAGPGNTGPSNTGQAKESAGGAPESTGSGNVLIGYGTTDTGARGRTRRRRGAAAGAQPAPVARAAPTAPAPPAPVAVEPRASEGSVPRVSSPLVRQLARDHGVVLDTLAGTGADGMIMRRDVEQAIGLQDQPNESDLTEADQTVTGQHAIAQSETDARSGLGISSRTTPSMFRRTVAAALAKSRTEIPEATVWVDVDATALLEVRRKLTAKGDRTPGILSLVSRFVVAGLERFPALNGRIDTDSGQLLQFDGVNLGFAAQTERGLVVPAIRSAHTLTVRELDADILRLTELARSGQAAPADLSGSTFTINNYGVFGVDGSAAIINYPEVAIMGLGRIIERPWVLDGQIVPRHITQLSIVFDHRVCDGGEAAGLLRFVADAIENPLALYADL